MTSTEKLNRRLKLRKFKQVRGDYYGTPKEIWGFRTKTTPSTSRKIARDFLLANADLFKIKKGIEGLIIQRVIHSLGATHVVLKQVHKGHRVHRGYVSVHIDRSGRVFLAKNRVVPDILLPHVFQKGLTRAEAVRQARLCLPKKERRARLRETELLWFPHKDQLIPAWKVRLTRDAPREEWLVYLNTRTGTELSRYNNLAEAAVGRGWVFDPNPVTALGDHQLLIARNRRMRRPPPVAYREVLLPGLDTSGTLSGEKVTTAETRARVRSTTGSFLLRSHQRGFEEVMVYYHVDSALRYLESLGYRGIRSIFHTPVRANVTGTRDDNSWYSPIDRSLTFGTGDINDAEDAETILHELGHAIQDAICPDFGQSAQAAAMGEGFGDYFAASFFESRKPTRYRDTVMSWDGLLLGLRIHSESPSLRRLDDTRSFKDFDETGDEHDNGTIWSAALWEIRAALGRQVGDTLIIESHFQLDGFTTFARGARAILDADLNLYDGRHCKVLARIFRRRKIGPL